MLTTKRKKKKVIFLAFFVFVASQHRQEIMGFSNGEQIKSQRDPSQGSQTKNLVTFFSTLPMLSPVTNTVVKRRNTKSTGKSTRLFTVTR